MSTLNPLYVVSAVAAACLFLSGCLANHSVMVQNAYGSRAGDMPSFDEPKISAAQQRFLGNLSHYRRTNQFSGASELPSCDLPVNVVKEILEIQDVRDVRAEQLKLSGSAGDGSLAVQSAASSAAAALPDKHIIRTQLLSYDYRTSPANCELHKRGETPIEEEYFLTAQFDAISELVINVMGRRQERSNTIRRENFRFGRRWQEVDGTPALEEQIYESMSYTAGASIMHRSLLGMV